MKTSVLKQFFAILFKKETHFSFLGVILALAGMAQTYTTQTDGNWSNPSTWVGGIVPATTIAAGQTVVIKNKVTVDQNNDLAISGTLSILNDTLVFGSSYDKDIKVNAGGLFSVSNGVIIQDMASRKSSFSVNGGRVSFSKSIVYVSRDFLGTNGGSRFFIDTKVYVGRKYELGGTSSKSFIDTIKNSLIQISLYEGGDFSINNYGVLKVANAVIKVENGNSFKNTGGGAISVLKGANSNYGFDLLKVTKDLQNDGSWKARIDAVCISGAIKGSQMADIDFTRSQDCAVNPSIGDAPELIFKNPVLVKGTAKKPGAVYRFANVVGGVDAEITLKKFSRPDIQFDYIDRPDLGWDKAFQPSFGLSGWVAPLQNWYVDFQVKFYKAGTNTAIIVPKVDMTAIDVDGDGVSVSEYAVFQNPSNVIYSTFNYLTEQPAGGLGQNFKCPVCNLLSLLIACPICGGDGKTGMWNLSDCLACNATGLIHSTCGHPYDETHGNILEGPVKNFNNIDTSATQVMATYQYTEVSVIDFRYGAKSGSVGSSGAGIRLNSLWFRQFNLSPASILPVKLHNFSAILNNKDVNLTWTADEENVSRYVLQRSTDGTHYADIAIVFANNANAASTYKYRDVNVSSATNAIYYRLLMIDIGKETGSYSPIRVIRLGKEAEALKLVTYPNPAKEQLKITLPSAWQGKPVLLQLYNANGIVVQSMQLGNASQTETMQIGTAAKGFYLVKAICNGEVAEQRIIKN